MNLLSALALLTLLTLLLSYWCSVKLQKDEKFAKSAKGLALARSQRVAQTGVTLIEVTSRAAWDGDDAMPNQQ